MCRRDRKGYAAEWREPLVFGHDRYEFITHPVPSSGGMTIAQTLAVMNMQVLKRAGYHSAKAVSMVTEAQRLAFADRNFWLGDPDYFNVPVDRLLSRDYMEQRRRLLPQDGLAGRSEGVSHGPAESDETTHFTVADRAGNVAAITTTLNGGYGLGAVATGAGFLWNNEMDNFSARPGVPATNSAVNSVSPASAVTGLPSTWMVISGRSVSLNRTNWPRPGCVLTLLLSPARIEVARIYPAFP